MPVAPTTNWAAGRGAGRREKRERGRGGKEEGQKGGGAEKEGENGRGRVGGREREGNHGGEQGRSYKEHNI